MKGMIFYISSRAKIGVTINLTSVSKVATVSVQTGWITKQEIANQFKINRKTISKYFEAIGIKGRKRISPKQYKIFCDHYVFYNGTE